MFCLGCGAEMRGAGVCATCGRPWGEGALADASPQPPMGSLASVPTAPAPQLDPPSEPAPLTATHGQQGAPDAPGWPRDTPGRVIFCTLVVLALALFLSWGSIGNSDLVPARLVAPTAVVLALLAATAYQAVRSPRPRLSGGALLAPMVGAFCVAAALTTWVFGVLFFRNVLPLGHANGAGLFTHPQPASSVISVSPTSDIPVGVGFNPSLGLFIFLAGGVVLGWAGYQRFLLASEAMRAQAEAHTAHASEAPITPPANAAPPPEVRLAPARPMRPVTTGPILPGSAAWTATPAPPTLARGTQRGTSPRTLR